MLLLAVITIEDSTLHYVIYGVMTLIIVYLFTRKSYRPKSPVVLTPKEINELITTWEPTPLVASQPDPYYKFNIENIPVVTSVDRNLINLEGAENLINCATTNYLCFGQGSEHTEPQIISTFRKTGTGSCGPRNFYGTLDVHIEFEKKMAEFLQVDSAILYASAIATCASVIPCFANREDYILSDIRVRKSIQMGNFSSRANVQYFRHNDMNHLEELMIQITQDLKKKKNKKARRFVTVEGIYHNYGTMCRLREVVALAKQYKFRVILDDSDGLGTVGPTGRGTVEALGLKMSDIQIYCADISSLGSLGGVCCGRTDMVRVQRLNGSGYMYSASNPPYLATAGTSALHTIDNMPEIVKTLQDRSLQLHKQLSEIPQIEMEGYEQCPFVVFRLKENFRPEERLDEAKLYQNIVTRVMERGVAITRTKYTQQEKFPPPPQIKVTMMALHTEEQVNKVVSAIRESINEILNE